MVAFTAENTSVFDSQKRFQISLWSINNMLKQVYIFWENDIVQQVMFSNDDLPYACYC